MGKEQNYVTGAVRQYSRLFTFPSYRRLLAIMLLLVTLVIEVVFLLVSFSLASLLRGLLFSFGILLVPTIFADAVTSQFSKDAILDRRRLTALSVVTVSAWAIIVLVGAVLWRVSGLVGSERAFFLGASLMIGFRFLVVKSMTSLEPLDFLNVVLFSPSLCLMSASVLWWRPSTMLLATGGTAALLVSAGVLFLRILDRHGERAVGVGAVRLFRGFILDWLCDVTTPLEEHLEEMAEETVASAVVISFAHDTVPHGVIVVSDIHPGPFRRIGSSNIPYEIQIALERKTGALVMVPHGTSGHERDLASERQRVKFIAGILERTSFDGSSGNATKAIRRFSGSAQAICQAFDGTVMVILTCAPESMEDIPFDVGEEIRLKGKELGAEEVVVIDAHNSIGSLDEVPRLQPEQLTNLKLAAENAMRDALRSDSSEFRFGASRILPKGLGVREGLGPGGIAVSVVEVQNQKTAYVTLDGNNMAKGLREQVREAVMNIVEEAEVLATDTHVVNGVSLTERGYHPVGEVGSREDLVSSIHECTVEAVSRLEESRQSFRRIRVPGLLVIGEEKLRELSLLIDSSVTLFGRLVFLIYVPTILLAGLVFLLIP